MKPPTKKQRHQIYIEAKELLERRYGICWAITHAKSAKKEWNAFHKMEYFPEVLKQKPEKHGMFWFKFDDDQSRVNILNNAIEETKL